VDIPSVLALLCLVFLNNLASKAVYFTHATPHTPYTYTRCTTQYTVSTKPQGTTVVEAIAIATKITVAIMMLVIMDDDGDEGGCSSIGS